MNNQQIKDILTLIQSSQDSNSVVVYCDQLIKIPGIDRLEKKFRTFYLPVRLNINGTIVKYVINTDETFVDFETELIQTFGLQQPFSIALEVTIDRIFYQRKLCNYILRPNQLITITSLIHEDPTIPVYSTEGIVFPWKEFFEAFNFHLNSEKEGKENIIEKLLSIICRIPHDQHYFTYEKNTTQLICLCHLFLKNRTIDITKEQCIDAIKYALDLQSSKLFGFISSILLSICILNDYKLPEELLKQLNARREKENTKRETEKQRTKDLMDPINDYAIELFSYYCEDIEKRTSKMLPYLGDASFYDIIMEADTEFNLDEDQILYVFAQLEKFLDQTKKPQVVKKGISIFCYQLSEMEENAEKHYYVESVWMYGYLYLTQKMVEKYGFKYMPKKMCMTLVNLFFAQMQGDEKKLLGCQSNALLIDILSRSEKLKEFIAKYVIKLVETQGSQEKILLHHTFECYFKQQFDDIKSQMNEKEIVAYVFALYYISLVDKIDNDVMCFMEDFKYFPPRKVDLFSMYTMNEMTQSSENSFPPFCQIAMKNGINSMIMKFETEEELMTNLQTKRSNTQNINYGYCSTTVPMKISLPLDDMKNNSHSYFGNTIIVIICEDYSLYVRNGNTDDFILIKDGKIQRTLKGTIDLIPSTKIQQGLVIRDIVYRIEKNEPLQLQSFNVEMRMIDSCDAFIRTSAHLSKLLNGKGISLLLKNILKRYDQCYTSAIYQETKKILLTMNTNELTEIFKTMLTPSEFINFLKQGECEKELVEDLFELLIAIIKLLPTDDNELVYTYLKQVEYQPRFIKLCVECGNNESIKRYVSDELKSFFNLNNDYEKEFDQLLTSVISQPFEKYEKVFKDSIKSIRRLHSVYPHYEELLRLYGSKSERIGFMKPLMFSELSNEKKIEYLSTIDMSCITLSGCEVIQKYKRRLNNRVSQKDVYAKIDSLIAILKQKFPRRQFFDDCFDRFYETVNKPMTIDELQ